MHYAKLLEDAERRWQFVCSCGTQGMVGDRLQACDGLDKHEATVRQPVYTHRLSTH